MTITSALAIAIAVAAYIALLTAVGLLIDEARTTRSLRNVLDASASRIRTASAQPRTDQSDPLATDAAVLRVINEIAQGTASPARPLWLWLFAMVLFALAVAVETSSRWLP